MRSPKQPYNQDTLEKEIYRLQLAAKDSEKQLGKDFEYFKEHFFSLARNTIKKGRQKENSSFFDHVFNNDHVRAAVSGITDRITGHVEEAVEQLIDRLFNKRK